MLPSTYIITVSGKYFEKFFIMRLPWLIAEEVDLICKILLLFKVAYNWENPDNCRENIPRQLDKVY